MSFSFATSNNIQFGEGIAKTIPSLLDGSLSPLFVLTGSDSKRYAQLIGLLTQSGFEVFIHPIAGEPDVKSVTIASDSAREASAKCVIAIGGGSVLDTGKAVAALVTNEGQLIDYLEGVGKGKTLSEKSLPFMAVPTTAGTGAEVTRNSVIGVPKAGVKVSLRSASMLPTWAVVDPELTYKLPPEIAAYTGMDALIQCLEAYLSKFSNPLTDGIAREGLRLAARSIRSACKEELDTEAKSDLCAASLCGGIALANAKLGSIHGFAGPLGGMIPAPHGAICASLLISCFSANLRAFDTRDKDNPSRAKMDDVATLLTGNPQAKASYALAWFESLCNDLPLKSLGELGLEHSQIEEAARKSAKSSSMKGNPIELTKFELVEILEAAL
ncbi:iron-containing alcohol dehydrogenase [Pelagicoccus sp. SDUM812002]|uniref:iron-containing alcohol dehydrogenase n=1 Tax=Pelagicoccus sp. SDUM812002 TaxID=3041266 RepID=UPI00280DA71D|nr:iron-containing alcohol dehydrogenase [Pelagicoccus sp. SDUM812002]MDQ8185197.1 iron-containing alcohol dehydrogenase [Pelagicoccus sp. SDUM812002]